jgi:F-type H+-transporting ATPase subunit c
MRLPRPFHHLKLIFQTVLFVAFFMTSVSAIHAQQATTFSFNDFHTGSAKIAGLPFQLTITALDQNGDHMLTYTGAANLSDETGTIYPTQTGNFIGGIWTGMVYVTQATNTNQITASFNTAIKTSEIFTVVPDMRMKYLSITSGNYQVGIVGIQLPQILTVKVIDPYGNLLPNIGVNFAVTSVPTNATGHSLTANSGISDAQGLASTILTLGNKIGNYVVSATLATGVEHTAQFSETALPSTLISLTITPYIAVMPAGGYLPFKATGYDRFFNEIASPPVTWSVQNGGGTIDNAGVFYSGYVLGNFANTIKAVTANAGATAGVSIVDVYRGATSNQPGSGTGNTNGVGIASVAALPTPKPGALINIQIEPEVLALLKNARIPILAEGVDAFGNSVSGVSYGFETSGDLGSITQTGPNSALLTAGEGGSGYVTITATQGNVTKTAKIVGSVGAGFDRRLIIEEIASPQQVGEPFTISIAAKDFENNFITDYKGPLVIADTTGTIDPAVVQPSDQGIWYVQAIISASNPEVSITVAGDGMVGVSNVFEVIGDPKKSELGFGKAGSGGLGDVLGASISGKIEEILKGQNINKYSIFRYIGAGLAAGFGILGASIGGGLMASKGLEAIGRNPFAKSRLQANLYASLVVFIIAASLAVFVSTVIMK